MTTKLFISLNKAIELLVHTDISPAAQLFTCFGPRDYFRRIKCINTGHF